MGRRCCYTADRPPELQDCNSGQKIDQLNFFGRYVRAFQQLALPSGDLFDYLRQTLVHAVAQTLQARSGPVQLNMPFRDPLVPQPDQAPVCEAAVLERAATVVTRITEAVTAFNAVDVVAVERMMSHPRGIIVVGTENSPCGGREFSSAVAELEKARLAGVD